MNHSGRTTDELEAQKRAFLEGEGDRWYDRNREAIVGAHPDLVVESLQYLELSPKRILEIGCSNGHRLAACRQAWGAACFGVDPSAKAVQAGVQANPGLELAVGTADNLPFPNNSFDTVVLGFCCYLIDPQLHFKCVYEADRVLQDGGTLAIMDFLSPLPHKNVYAHKQGVYSFKTEFSRYFAAHPAYHLVHRQLEKKGERFLEVDFRSGVDILVKRMDTAFPRNPFAADSSAPAKA